MLKTCKNTDRPPIPSKKADKIMFIEIFFIGILEIIEIPFVISKKPVKSEQAKDWGICKNVSRGYINVDTRLVK